ncbi:hypothetical protein FUA23_12250 [Neolewinella aurantiaca]|uniref:Secreted protein with PEP-CTERM sorting signal n=1 Tax=Neolewinella aurantiaca TaxID=2602767 RepID=A0A5C7FUF4_9BACT|nr:hypothetical protein [Neolewinella aurantiaca]TXF89051.1 hypothetical protein FUA23_12250 [Neolewinella aurantiaca]
MTNRITFFLLSAFLSANALLGQEPVDSPNRGATYVADNEVWYAQPFIWIGAVILILVVVLFMLRKKGSTNMPQHKY